MTIDPPTPETAPGGAAESGRVRVAVVDDDTVIRDGVPLLVPDFDVVAAFYDADALLAASPRVDVVLVDLKLSGTGRAPKLQGPAAVRAVAEAGHSVLVYTNERRRAVLVNCMSVGARGVVHKSEPLSALAEGVALVARGHIVITQALTGLAELAGRRHQLPGLSRREQEVLAGRSRGESFASIAKRLYIADDTASGYMENVKEKFADYLRGHSPADLERLLGLEPADLDDWEPPRKPS